MDDPIKVMIVREPSPPTSKWDKAFAFLVFLGVLWTALPPRKRRG